MFENHVGVHLFSLKTAGVIFGIFGKRAVLEAQVARVTDLGWDG